jgi:peptidoglycan/xylan/chitin deacetylase (PgdA/CDA1 family)
MRTRLPWVVMVVASTLASPARAGDPQGAGHVTGEGPRGYVHFTFDDDADGQTWEVAQLLANAKVPATFFVDVDKLRLLSTAESDAVLRVITSAPAHLGLFLTEPAAGARRNPVATLDELSGLNPQSIALYRGDPNISGESRRALTKRGLTEVKWSIATADLATSDPRVWGVQVVERIVHANGGVVRIRTTATNRPALTSALIAALDRENCQRSKAGTALITAAPIDFFIRDGSRARAVPAAAKASVTAYLDALGKKCVVLLNDYPEQMNKPIGTSKECLDNPLAKGCS